MLKIKRLASTKLYLTNNEQQQIIGGYTTTEKLWEGYSSEEYNLEIAQKHRGRNGTYAKFMGTSYDDSGKIDVVEGVIDLTSGKKLPTGYYKNDD